MLKLGTYQPGYLYMTPPEENLSVMFEVHSNGLTWTIPSPPMNSPPLAITSASVGSAKPAGKLAVLDIPERKNIQLRAFKFHGLKSVRSMDFDTGTVQQGRTLGRLELWTWCGS